MNRDNRGGPVMSSDQSPGQFQRPEVVAPPSYIQGYPSQLAFGNSSTDAPAFSNIMYTQTVYTQQPQQFELQQAVTNQESSDNAGCCAVPNNEEEAGPTLEQVDNSVRRVFLLKVRSDSHSTSYSLLSCATSFTLCVREYMCLQ